MASNIESSLKRIFESNRIVFWYDSKNELGQTFDELVLEGVNKVRLQNNEFGIKYRMLRTQRDERFLIFHNGPPPSNLRNWLLDVQLSHFEFKSDQASIWLSELELSRDFEEIVSLHREFFKSERRRSNLRKLSNQNDTRAVIRTKMLAVCAGSEPRLDSVLETLLQEAATGNDEKYKLIERCALTTFLWGQADKFYGYNSAEPSVKDFAIELFKSSYAKSLGTESRLNDESVVFIRRWKDSRQFEFGFESLSTECSEVLGIQRELEERDFRTLLEIDYFKLVDQKIASDLVRGVADKTISDGEVSIVVRQRRQSHWYKDFEDIYEAVSFAAQFSRSLLETELSMTGINDAVERYRTNWFRIDQYYRKFVYYCRRSSQATLLSPLADQVENSYANSFLVKAGNRFQEVVESADQWEAFPIPNQKSFFEKAVRPFVARENKICVIISDALRYEIADELMTRIQNEDRFSAELDVMLSNLPSYTQMGMAALLPNQSIEICEDDSGTVLVDGQSSQGTVNRRKILSRIQGVRTSAYKFEEIMLLNGDDCRTIVRENDVIYIYHNRIDATGDKNATEERVFEAVEETIDELVRLVKKLTGANLNNLIVTSDHGFIYQNRPIEESDFLSKDVNGDRILYRDRRFVLGLGLDKSSSFHSFRPESIGLNGNVEVQIPKSINRLRLKGSGSRFVHGGATLQEVVVPLLRINKKRQSDVSYVDIDIIRGASTTITAGQIAVLFYQSSPATDKIHPRVLRAGIFTESGELISDSHEINFDLRSDNPREREIPVRFVLSRKADEFNGQEVLLRLEEKHAGTTHYKEYRSIRYTIRRSFTSDFDF